MVDDGVDDHERDCLASTARQNDSMDTFHEQRSTGYQVALDDWTTIQRLADVMAQYADVRFEASDDRGSYGADELESVIAKIAARDRPPDAVSIRAHTPGSDRVSASVTVWPEHDVEYLVRGSDEEAVLFLKNRIESIVAGAGTPWSEETIDEDDEDRSAEPISTPVRARRSFLSHPNWAGISVLIPIALAVLGWFFFRQ